LWSLFRNGELGRFRSTRKEITSNENVYEMSLQHDENYVVRKRRISSDQILALPKNNTGSPAQHGEDVSDTRADRRVRR
jgi:hypothetical protein